MTIHTRVDEVAARLMLSPCKAKLRDREGNAEANYAYAKTFVTCRKCLRWFDAEG